ncbi:MAG: flagellar type III secretion system protein FlhB [Sphingopyxis sp.]
MASEKTERPTAKRKKTAAERGDVLTSKETGVAFVTSIGMIWLFVSGGNFTDALRRMLTQALTFSHQDIEQFNAMAAISQLIGVIAGPLTLLFAILMLAAIASPALLGSLGFRAAAWQFKPSRINPLAGLKRMFGANGLVELAKSIAKIAVLGAIGWWTISTFTHSISSPNGANIEAIVAQMGRDMALSFVIMCGGLWLIAIIDAPAQFLMRLKRLMMSRQEVKDEHRQSEGAPEQKSEIRRRQYAGLRGSARQAVAQATVVLTNPTHFAVALRYRPGEDAAPIVVARGRGATAQAVRELAKSADVPTLNYPELTRALYYSTRTGEPIREDLYMAVATILGFVLNIERRANEQAPEVSVPPGARFDTEGRLV